MGSAGNAQEISRQGPNILDMLETIKSVRTNAMARSNATAAEGPGQSAHDEAEILKLEQKLLLANAGLLEIRKGAIFKKVVEPSNGQPTRPAHVVKIHYTGWLANIVGKSGQRPFECTRAARRPLAFRLGLREVHLTRPSTCPPPMSSAGPLCKRTVAWRCRGLAKPRCRVERGARNR
jgi:hypothetical protein